MYGRTDEEWAELVNETEKLLKKRASLKRTPSYTDLNRDLHAKTGQPLFDFSYPSQRAAIGELLGQVSLRTLEQDGVMLSAIVLYGDSNDVGKGFINLAIHLGLLSKDATEDQQRKFWYDQMNKAFSLYRK